MDEQWTIGPIDGEIVSFLAEIVHLTKDHIYQGEMEIFLSIILDVKFDSSRNRSSIRRNTSTGRYQAC